MIPTGHNCGKEGSKDLVIRVGNFRTGSHDNFNLRKIDQVTTSGRDQEVTEGGRIERFDHQISDSETLDPGYSLWEVSLPARHVRSEIGRNIGCRGVAPAEAAEQAATFESLCQIVALTGA